MPIPDPVLPGTDLKSISETLKQQLEELKASANAIKLDEINLDAVVANSEEVRNNVTVLLYLSIVLFISFFHYSPRFVARMKRTIVRLPLFMMLIWMWKKHPPSRLCRRGGARVIKSLFDSANQNELYYK